MLPINTRRKLFAATAISANFVNDIMARSRSRRQVLVADCCYSGAFGRGFVTRADKKIHTGEYFDQGRGRIVLTASDSMQYSFEEDKLQVEVKEPGSIFTRALVEGLNTGKADLNEDGLVSYDELYDYTFDRVIDETPNQRPQKWEFGVEGDVVIAKNPYKRMIEDPNELVQDALDYLKKGEYNATLEYSDKAIKIKPTFALAYNIKGQAFFSLRQYQEALICYDKTLELRPNYIEAISNKGLVYAAIGDYNKAIECFDQSTDLNPSDASIWNYKGLAFHGLGKYEDAIVSFDRAIILRHNYIEAVNNRELSSIQIKKKQHEERQKQQQEAQIGTTTRTPIGTHYQPHSVPYTSNTKEDTGSDIPKVKGAVPSINTSSTYGVSEDNRHFDTKEIKEPSSNLKILIPVVAVVIGVVIAVVIFGSGMMHQHLQPSAPTSSPLNPSPSPAHVTPLTTHAVSNNTPPTATDQSVTTKLNTPVEITLAGSDPANQNATLTAHIISQPLHGKLSDVNQDTGFITYTPNQGFTGDDSFTFKVNDGKIDSNNTATVYVKVNGVAPITSENTNRTTASSLVSSTISPISY